MTITPSATTRRVVIAWARHDIEVFTASGPTREQVEILLPLWLGYGGMTEDERAEVIAAYEPAEREPVPGVDYLEQAEPVTRVRRRSLSEMIDAANAEAEAFNAEFPPGTRVEYWSGAREGAGKIGRTYGEAFASSSGQAVVFLSNASSYHALSHVRPLVEVTPQPTAEAVPPADAPVRGALARAGAVLCETCGGCNPEHRRGCPHRRLLTPPAWDEQGNAIRYDEAVQP